MKHLFTFFSKKDKKLLLTILFVRLIQTLGDFVQPLMLLVIFDIINPNLANDLNPFMQFIVTMSQHFRAMFNGNQMASLSIVFVIMATGALFTLISGAVSNVLTARIGMGFGYNIRDRYYNKVQSLSASDIDKFSISSLTTRMTADITMIQNVFIRSLSIIPRAIALFVGSIIFAFFINPIYGTYFLGALFLLIIILGILFKIMIPTFYNLQSSLDSANEKMRENLLGVRIVKSNNLQKLEIKYFNKVNDKLTKYGISSSIASLSFSPFVLILINLVIVLIIATNPPGTVNDEIASLTNLAALTAAGLMLLSSIVGEIGWSQATIRRVNEVFFTNPSIQESENPINIDTNFDIVFENVNFKYNNSEEWILNDINLKIKNKSSLGIIGHSGSGKTSLINLITRLYDIDSGKLLINDNDIKDLSLKSLRDNISITPQKSVLFSGTIRSNIYYGKDDPTEEELEKALESSCVNEVLATKVDGLDEIVEQRGENFSGGQKQRISIARSLIKEPRVLIFDDSTSALDMLTEKNVQSMINKNYQNATKIFIAQRITALKNLDNIIVMENGKIISQGTHKYLLNNCEYYYDIALNQLGEEEIKNDTK